VLRFEFRRHTPLRLFSLLLLISLCATSFGGCTMHGTRSDPPGSLTEHPSEDIPVIGGTEEITPKKRVAITFDDGPQYYNGEETRSIVDELAKYGFTATFFMVGNRIQSNDDLLPYIVQNGCEIGIHGYTHDTSAYYDSCSDETYEMEINRTAQAILAQIPDYEIKLMRPVGGRISYDRVNSSPYSVIMWSVDSDDWNNRYSASRCNCDEDAGITCDYCQKVVDTIVSNVMTQVSDGDIILLHDIYLSTYDATVVILKQLYEAGYEVVSVSELLGDQLEPGQKYYSYWE
jgi:peptidoglycan/xylan/chitin deacetylase (PgdA/CDA1 family)